jgi:hypothetical protein
MTEPNPNNNGSASPEVAQSRAEKLPGRVIGERYTPSQNDAPSYYTEKAQSTREAAIDRMITRKLQASIHSQEEHARFVACFRIRERAKRILEAIRAR